MTIAQVNVSSPSNEFIYTNTALGNAGSGIKSSSALLYAVKVDNSANSADSYVKLYNVVSGSVVVGTTAPDEIIYVPLGTVVTVTYFTGAAPGKTFGVALTAACVTTGGTAGVTSPVSSVIVSANYV